MTKLNNDIYLSERKYLENEQLKVDEKKKAYWKSLLGEGVYRNLTKSNSNFNNYLMTNLFVETRKGDMNKFLEFIMNPDYKKSKQCMKNELGDGIFFPEFYNIILDYGLEELKKELKGKKEYFSEEIYDNFILHLSRQLQSVAIRTLIASMHCAKNNGILEGTDTKSEYDFFCSHIVGSRKFLEESLEQYPVLYRCLKEKAEHMVRFYDEVVTCFKNDRIRIGEKLCKKELHKITAIKGNFSDLHNNGKQVLQVQFDNKMEVLFKPRSMETEQKHEKLLQWLGEKTGIDQLMYPFLSFSDHSWSAIVAYQTCETKMQLENYYKRLGVQLFLAYLLGTTDLHSENMIACGEYPVLIDLETLIHAQNRKERITVNDEIIHQLSQSVLYTGILPVYHWNQNGNGIRNSAIGEPAGEVLPFKLPTVMQGGTSEMHMGYYFPTFQKAKNQARLNGKFLSPSLFHAELVQGFQAAYQVVLTRKAAFLKLADELCGISNRFLAADTQRYAMLLSSSYHPSLLKDGAEREIFLHSIWMGRKAEELELIKSEVHSLLQGDVPYFYYRTNSTDLITAQSEKLKDFFACTAMQVLYQKIDALSDTDLQKQCEYIKLALDLTPDENEHLINRVYEVKETEISEYQTKVERNIARLTERLLKYAVWNQKRTEVSWYNVHLSFYEKYTWDIKPMNIYLYDGLAGMALLFSALQETNKSEEVSRIFQNLVDRLFEYTDSGVKSSGKLQSQNTGAYTGEASIIYTYLILYRSRKQKGYLQYAVKHAQIIDGLLKGDTKYDVLSGNAGAAQILLLLYETVRDSQYIDMAERAIDVLEQSARRLEKGIGWIVEESEQPMGGMAHGNSGILMPVIWLWTLTGKDKYRKLAEQIWEYEESLYDPGIHNWTDVRAKEADNDQVGTVAWCHGASGILLARLECYKKVESEEWKKRFEKDLFRAYDKLKRYWKRDSWCLCHGSCGNLWILEKVVEILREQFTECDEFAADPVNRNWLCEEIGLLPQEKMNPGLLNGYGGILLYLLEKSKKSGGIGTE